MLLQAQQFTDDDLAKVRLLESTVIREHILGAQIADSLSKRLPIEFIKELDPGGNLLIADQVAEIQSMIGTNIPLTDAELRALLKRSAQIFSERINYVTDMLEQLGDQDFFEEDSAYFSLSTAPTDYTTNDQALKAFWISSMKANVLSISAKDSTLKAKTNAEINEQMNRYFRDQRDIELCKIAQLNGDVGVDEYVLERYMKAFASCFDPHTEYFKMDYVSWFLSALSDETYSSGIFFSEKKGRYIIRDLAPYSPISEYADEIYIGDEIVSVVAEGTKTHPACLSPDLLNQYFNGIVSDSITIEIQSIKDQQIREFKLAKQKLGSRSNHIYYYLLANENNQIGYIDFPSFYSEFSEDGEGSSKDLAYAILKLKRSAPQGLILDLRNNGGGSIREAIEMAGFFVDIGPLFYIESTDLEGDQLIIDGKRGRIFTGKIMLLVNELSASASELVASAMQRHPDVLLVGTRTFGKSTGQGIEPLLAEGETLPFGALKVTTSKLRGIDGISYQGEGVTPDIVLPSYYGKKMVSESLYPYSLNIGIKNLSARMPQTRSEPVERLKEAYQSRHQESEMLRKMAHRENEISDVFSKGFYRSLNFRRYNGEIDRLINMNFEVTQPYFRAKSLETDDEFKDYSLVKKARLEKDLQLTEAFKIFEDWILLTK
ncbi:MAG: S41 family peptidase [Bacteroidota bacterium]